MFLGLLKPIKIKYGISHGKKKIMCQRGAFICGCDTVLSNNKRHLTIAFTVLEEIYFSLPALREGAHYTAVQSAETQTKGIMHKWE